MAFAKLRCKVFAFALLLSLAFTGCGELHDAFREDANSNQTNVNRSQTPPAPESIHLAFGNPSKATLDPADDENFLIVGDGSVISYNNRRGTANWVSWKTTRADVGKTLPRPNFRPDPRLPGWYNRIGQYDYSGSGYDRGHLVPSADRFGNPRLNQETFLMTNIVPQTGALNQYPWNKLENYARSQARGRFDVYQIAGVYGDAGRLKGKITVPTNCWKVVMIVPRGASADDLNERIRIIAVDMPNIEGIEDERWERYRTTIRAIESKTGLDLFSHLPRQLQNTIEMRMETVSTRR
jgi:endonuclease G, mitochondrial